MNCSVQYSTLFVVSKTQAAALDLDIIDEKEEELGIQTTPFKSGFISIIGNANVGKSTLMNGWCHHKLLLFSILLYTMEK